MYVPKKFHEKEMLVPKIEKSADPIMIIPGVTKGKGIFIPHEKSTKGKAVGDLVIPDICLENVPQVKDVVIPDAPKKLYQKLYHKRKVCTITHNHNNNNNNNNNKEDTLHNQLTTKEDTKRVIKTKDTLHNQPTTKEDTKRVIKTEDTLHNQLTTKEDTKRVIKTKDTLHNHLTTK